MAARTTTRRPSRRRATAAAHYEVRDMALLWIKNGGPTKYANAMAIVAQAESGGDPNVVNSIKATGLWQIYDEGKMTPARVRQLQDPNANARAAIKKFRAAKFQPWSSSEGVWGSQLNKDTGEVNKDVAEKYGLKFSKSFLQKLATSGAGDALAGAVKPLEPLQALGELAIGLTELLLTPEGWRRLLKVILGGVILLWALNQLSKAMFDVNPARGVRKLAGTAAIAKAAA